MTEDQKVLRQLRRLTSVKRASIIGRILYRMKQLKVDPEVIRDVRFKMYNCDRVTFPKVATASIERGYCIGHEQAEKLLVEIAKR